MSDVQRFRDLHEECRPRVLAHAWSPVGRQVGEDTTSETFTVARRRVRDNPTPPLPAAAGGPQSDPRLNEGTVFVSRAVAFDVTGRPERGPTRVGGRGGARSCRSFQPAWDGACLMPSTIARFRIALV
ncbi:MULTISPECIES: hypothetical protein [unclassified Streptomyces]|uniref:hypothetical protein n=1 Tax=unclassified Streptomyces TaxID=2593676 RepID=UPI0038024F75